MDGAGELAGARVRRIDVPFDDLIAVTIALEGRKGCLVAAIDPPARGVGWVEERPRGDPAGPFARKLRKELGGARIAGLDPVPGGLRMRFGPGEGRPSLLLELCGERGNALLLDEADRVLAALRPQRLGARELAVGRPWVAPAAPPAQVPEGPALREAGSALLRAHDEDRIEARRRVLRKALGRARKRLDRRLAAVEGDAERAEQAPELRQVASLIVSNLHRVGPRDRELTATDWHADPPAERTIALDPELGAREQADRLFHRARRLERGARIATERWESTAEQREAVSRLLEEVDAATDAEQLEEIAERARALGLRELRGESGEPGRRRASARRKPYRSFEGSGGRTILVGRGAADNDELTLRYARPHDLWLHARGQRGAHVIVPLEKREVCPPELLADAATLAAHFSDARGEERVEVQHTPRRFIRKPRGAAPGAVLVDREKVMLLRLEPDRLARLLAREGER